VTVAVTGATGFLGPHITAALLGAGEQVRVLVRDPARLEALPGLQVEPVQADLWQRSAFVDAIRGCDVLFHVAGLVSGTQREELWRVNVSLARLAVEAAAAADVPRVVLTSSSMTMGPPPPGEVADETTPGANLGFLYADSKRDGELAAFEAGERLGVDVVVTSPTYCQGAPLNRSLTAGTSTRAVGNYLRGRLPLVLNSYNNFVSVGAVAHGHWLAAKHGRPGERYLLAGEDIRWADAIRRVRRLSGVVHPVIALPPSAGHLASKRILGVRLPLPREALRMMADDWRYSSAKAEEELGYSRGSADEGFKDLIDWYLELIESGRFAKSPRKSVDNVATGLRVANRLHLLSIVGAKRARRLVV
jgi:dihydroflavonol-4-reductase